MNDGAVMLAGSERDNHLLDCFDPKTELLTDRGWVGVAEVTHEMKCATVDLATDEIEYQAPFQILIRRHAGKMVHIGARRLDILVTPNHRMVTTRANPIRLDPAFTLARDLIIWHKIKMTARWRGCSKTFRSLPVADVGPRGNNVNKNNSFEQRARDVDAHDLAEFLGWYVAEGHRVSGRKFYGVSISQNPGAKQAQIVAVMQRIGLRPRIEDRKVTANSKQIHALLDECYEPGDGRGCYRKRVPAWVKDAQPSVIARFVDAAVAGDGWTDRRGHRAYATTSRRLADDMQELFIKLGRSATIRVVGPRPCRIRAGESSKTSVQYHVHEARASSALLRQSDNRPLFKTVPYDGMVHCVSVFNGTLIARRSGKSFIAGNCRVYNLALAASAGEGAEEGPAQ